MYVLHNTLPEICHTGNVKKKLLKYVTASVDFSQLTCDDHNLPNILKNIIVDFFIKIWITKINKTLKGLGSVNFENNTDQVRTMAHKRYLKFKKKSEKIKKLKRLV